MRTHTPCRLQDAAGRVEVCPEDECPFWEPGGAVLGGRCAIEQLDLRKSPQLVHGLLALRTSLETAAVSGAPHDARTWRLFHRLTRSGIREFPDSRAGIAAAQLRAESDGAPPAPGDSGRTT